MSHTPERACSPCWPRCTRPLNPEARARVRGAGAAGRGAVAVARVARGDGCGVPVAAARVRMYRLCPVGNKTGIMHRPHRVAAPQTLEWLLRREHALVRYVCVRVHGQCLGFRKPAGL